MSLVVLADAQARAGDAVTQDMIDEEEAWLTVELGPLTGELTETFYEPKHSTASNIDALYLSRRTATVDEFTSDGTVIAEADNWRLLRGYILERTDTGTAWGFPLTATYTPNDEEIVKGVIYDLLAYRLLPTNIQSIRIGQYSETYATGKADPVRANLLAKMNPAAGLGVYSTPFRYRRFARDRTLLEATGS
jgi:hypothetical protein